MKAKTVLTVAFAAVMALPCTAERVSDLVDPFWGSGGTTSPRAEGMAFGWNWEKAQSGNTHPGAVLPFGWVSACAYTGGYSSGYGRIGVSGGGGAPVKLSRMEGFGFTHFHQSGTGWCSVFYNLFRFTPSSGGKGTEKASAIVREKARPGYYAASLPGYGASFELTARRFAACHRYRFDGPDGRLDVNLEAAGFMRSIFGGRTNYNERVKLLGVESKDGAWTGSIAAYGLELWFSLRTVSGKVASSSVNGSVVTIRFSGSEAETAIGFSLKSREEACARAAEAAKTGFARSLAEAEAEWERQLGRVRVRFAEKALHGRFYSALYHSMVKPVDCGGRFTDFVTTWDVYRTQLPLVLSVSRETARPMLESLLRDSEELGFIVNFNTWRKRYRRRDVQASALGVFVLADGFFRGVLGKEDYPRLKAAFEREFTGVDVSKRPPSHALDLAGALMAGSFVAEMCGDAAYAKGLREKSRIWESVFDPATGYMTAKGKYYEGDCRTYSFRPLPFMERRVGLAGGEAEFNSKLDAFFAVGYKPRPNEYERRKRIGHFEGFNNESDIDAPLSYLWCGRTDRFAEVCDSGRRYRFTDGPGGAPGNNDSGGLSGWYVWSCLGLFPVSGTPYYALGNPSVDSAEVTMRRGILRIKVERESASSIYPADYTFRGRKFREPWLKVADVEDGGELVFRLTDQPGAKAPVPDWY